MDVVTSEVSPAQVLGLRVCDDSGTVEVAFDPGLTVLYGLNGAGKTWLLQHLCDSVLGQRQSLVMFASRELSLQLRDPDAPLWRQTAVTGMAKPLSYRDAVEVAVMKRGDDSVVPFGGALPDDYEDDGRLYVAAQVGREGVCALIARPPFFNAQPWELWASAWATENTAMGLDLLSMREIVDGGWRAATEGGGYTGPRDRNWISAASDLDSGVADQLDDAESSMREAGLANTWHFGQGVMMQPHWVADAERWPVPVLQVEMAGTPTFLPRLVHLPAGVVTAREDVERLICAAVEAEVMAQANANTASTPELLVALTDWAEVRTNVLDSVIEGVMGRVNEVYAALLLDAPRMSAQRVSVNILLRGGSPLRVVRSEGAESGSDGLSTAQRRWLLLAVELVTAGYPEGAPLVVLDEPEAGLHRAAEEYMADALTDLASKGVQVVTATHTPMLLNQSTATVYEVNRNSIGSVCQPIGPIQRESLDRLGLHTSDLLHRYKVIVLVEGIHDQIVVEHLLGDTLTRCRTLLLPIHGAAKLDETHDSQLLFDYTDAHVLAVLDNMRCERVERAWLNAQDTASRESISGAVDGLLRALPGEDAAEFIFIRQWLISALQAGRGSRVDPYGLSASDIVEYLPVDRLVRRARGQTWPELRAAHAAYTAPSGKKRQDFKTWLTNTHGGHFDPEDIRAALKYVNQTPADIERLGRRIEDLSLRTRGPATAPPKP